MSASPMRMAFGCLTAWMFAVIPSAQLAAKDLVKWNTYVVAGWVEPIYLGDTNVKLMAKLDTGAKTSSLNAENLTHLVR